MFPGEPGASKVRAAARFLFSSVCLPSCTAEGRDVVEERPVWTRCIVGNRVFQGSCCNAVKPQTVLSSYSDFSVLLWVKYCVLVIVYINEMKTRQLNGYWLKWHYNQQTYCFRLHVAYSCKSIYCCYTWQWNTVECILMRLRLLLYLLY